MRKIILGLALFSFVTSVYAQMETPVAADESAPVASKISSQKWRFSGYEEEVFDRKRYINVSLSNGRLTPKRRLLTGVDDGIVPAYKSDWGVSLVMGYRNKLHKEPIAKMVQFNLDYTWMDLNFNKYSHESGNYLYDSSVKQQIDGDQYYYIPWNLDKYALSYGMSVGPSVTVAPFIYTDAQAAHYVSVNLYYHLGYNIAGILHGDDSNADRNQGDISREDHDEMSDNTKVLWGHGITNKVGFSLTWKWIGLGYEYRSSVVKYKSVNTDDFGSTSYKFKEGLNRVYIQFRF